MLSIFTVKTIAAIFDFYNCGKLGRERNLYQGDEQWSKEEMEEGSFPALSPTVHFNCQSNTADRINDRKFLTLTL